MKIFKCHLFFTRTKEGYISCQRREISIFLVFDYSGGKMILFDAVVHETFPRENMSFCIYVKLIVAK